MRTGDANAVVRRDVASFVGAALAIAGASIKAVTRRQVAVRKALAAHFVAIGSSLATLRAANLAGITNVPAPAAVLQVGGSVDAGVSTRRQTVFAAHPRAHIRLYPFGFRCVGFRTIGGSRRL